VSPAAPEAAPAPGWAAARAPGQVGAFAGGALGMEGRGAGGPAHAGESSPLCGDITRDHRGTHARGSAGVMRDVRCHTFLETLNELTRVNSK
jgi:hypothetical protein